MMGTRIPYDRNANSENEFIGGLIVFFALLWAGFGLWSVLT